jgi:hypothetical protein
MERTAMAMIAANTPGPMIVTNSRPKSDWRRRSSACGVNLSQPDVIKLFERHCAQQLEPPLELLPSDVLTRT